MAVTPAVPARLGAEFLGTFWLVLGGCGTAVLAVTFPGIGVGLLGVALAFGLSVLTVAYAVGHVSGAHFNPAVTVGLAVARRFPWKDVPGYVLTQVVAAIAAGTVLLVIANGRSGFAANGFGAYSPGGYSLLAALVVEVVLTAFFLYIILGSTDGRAPVGFAPLALGLALTLVHLISIPVTNTSGTPARSTGVASFAATWALAQLWLFWLAPILGAAAAGATYVLITGQCDPTRPRGRSGRRRPGSGLVTAEGRRRGTTSLRRGDLLPVRDPGDRPGPGGGSRVTRPGRSLDGDRGRRALRTGLPRRVRERRSSSVGGGT